MMERHIDIATPSGAMETFAVHPSEGGPHPAVILYMDVWGIREELLDIARRIATVGYYCVVPDFYYRQGRVRNEFRNEKNQMISLDRLDEQRKQLVLAPLAKLTDAILNLSAAFGMGITSPPADVTLRDGDTYSAAGFDLEAREIPGHSRGHVIYLWMGQDPPIAFVGDVIFAGSIGRTDFPDGDFRQLIDGIRQKLFTLPDETILLSGHGPETTVGREKRTNPFVGLDTED